jgi:hypothetical protein
MVVRRQDLPMTGIVESVMVAGFDNQDGSVPVLLGVRRG